MTGEAAQTMAVADGADLFVQDGDPAADVRGFRECLSQYVTGVTIMTAAVEDELVGMTANSFASLSLDPPLVLWSIRKNSTSVAQFTSATHFSVNILASDQIELAKKFAISGREKFAGADCAPGVNGAPIFAGCTALLECVRQDLIDKGDHILIVGQVQRFARRMKQALVFNQGRFAAAVEHPATVLAGADTPLLDRPWAVLFRQAYAELNTVIDNLRTSVGLSFNQGRLLNVIRDNPGLTVDRLVPISLVESVAARDAASELADMALVSGPDGRFVITDEGQSRLSELLDGVRAMESRMLEGCSEQELAAAKKVLSALFRGAREVASAADAE